MEFQGFQNLLSPLLLVLLVIVILVLSWLSYRKVSRLPLSGKVLLTGLRSSALIILLLLLMNPFFFSNSTVSQKPGLAVYIDNSESIQVSKNEYGGIETANEVMDGLFSSLDSDIEPVIYSFSDEVRGPVSRDSIQFEGRETNLSAVVSDVLEQEDDIRAALIISDGIITYGRDPSFASTNSALPIYTLGLGDSARVRDQALSELIYPSEVYSNSIDQIQAQISQNGFQGSIANVSLFRGDTEISSKTLNYEVGESVQNVTFDIAFSDPGVFRYRVELSPLEEEFTLQNNRSDFTIEVKDSKIRILDVAFEVHPDVKALRNVLMSDRNHEVESLNYFNPITDKDKIPEGSFDLIVIHGSPSFSPGPEIVELIENTPTVYFAGPRSINSSNNLIDDLRIIGRQSNRITTTLPEPALSRDEHPVMDLETNDYSTFPPLLAPVRTQLRGGLSTTLFTGSYEGFSTNSIHIAVTENAGLRRSEVMPWNWYKWQLSEQELHRSAYTQLMSNIITWTYSDPGDDLLTTRTTRDSYTTLQTPVLSATLLNESGEREDEAIIEVSVMRDNEDNGSFNMENTGNGSYRLELPRLREGLYTYQATARKGNRKIDDAEGGFLVSNSSQERNNSIRNDELLSKIAAATGASYAAHTEWQALADSLNNDPLLQTYQRTESSYSFPVRNAAWFILVLLLLGAEWGLRKYYSLP